MPSYLVRWEIQVDAEDPELAVLEACQMFPIARDDRERESLATVFVVTEEDTRTAHIVDLDLINR